MTSYARVAEAEGMAALGICESLLLALTDLKIITEEDVHGLLTDVATTHQEAASASSATEKHQAVVKIIHSLLLGRGGT